MTVSIPLQLLLGTGRTTATTFHQQSNPGGGKHDSFQRGKKVLSNSAAGRLGPAVPVETTFCTQIWQRDSFVLGFIIMIFRPAESHPFCHAVVTIAVYFLIPAEILIPSHFLHPHSSCPLYTNLLNNQTSNLFSTACLPLDLVATLFVATLLLSSSSDPLRKKR